MNYLIFHPGIDRHPTDNEQTIKLNEFLSKKYEIKSLEWFLKNLNKPRIEVLYLNWYENPVKNTIPFIQGPIYRAKLWVLRHCKRNNIKIVYAFHNQLPHDVERNSFLYRHIAKPFEKKALLLADIIVIHSYYTLNYIKSEFEIDEELLRKVQYIPIGKDKKYILEEKKYHLRTRLGLSSDELVFGYIGRLTEYKQIDKAIIAFQKANVDAKLVIIGKADDSYQRKLNALVNTNKVIIEYRYLDDYEMNNSIAELDAMILPYDMTCLNSGPMLQAFLNGTTIIGTAIGTARDFPESLLYSYEYESDEEHIERIIKGIIAASKDFKLGLLRDKGIKLQKIVLERNDWNEIEQTVLKMI